jgi:hypothetical protein
VLLTSSLASFACYLGPVVNVSGTNSVKVNFSSGSRIAIFELIDLDVHFITDRSMLLQNPIYGICSLIIRYAHKNFQPYL